MEEEIENKKENNSLIWIIIMPLAFLSVALLYVFVFSNAADDIFPEDEKGKPYVHRLEGEVYITLAPLDQDLPDLYRLKLPSFTLEPVFEESEYRNYMANFSSDLKNMVFARGYEDSTFQILLLDEETQEISEVTPRTEFFVRNPIFSPDDDKIVYWLYENEQNPWGVGVQAEDNSIYISSLDGEREKIAEGVYPFFAPDEDIVIFMKNDGLYSLDLKTGNEELMIELFTAESLVTLPEHDALGWAALRLNYSIADNVFVITDSVNKEVHIFELETLTPFKYSSVKSFDASKPNWPVFHPNGDYFFILEYQEQGPGFPLLSFLYLDDEIPQRIDSFSLRNHDVVYVFSGDWVVR